jgi:hypothetical protein
MRRIGPAGPASSCLHVAFGQPVARVGVTATYVIGLLDEIIGERSCREVSFPWALGDPSPKTGRSRRLPFDAVWESRKLIIEVDEDQHRRPVTFFDKPDVMTVSGVSRDAQRRTYDARKRQAARRAGYARVQIPWELASAKVSQP